MYLCVNTIFLDKITALLRATLWSRNNDRREKKKLKFFRFVLSRMIAVHFLCFPRLMGLIARTLKQGSPSLQYQGSLNNTRAGDSELWVVSAELHRCTSLEARGF